MYLYVLDFSLCNSAFLTFFMRCWRLVGAENFSHQVGVGQPTARLEFFVVFVPSFNIFTKQVQVGWRNAASFNCVVFNNFHIPFPTFFLASSSIKSQKFLIWGMVLFVTKSIASSFASLIPLSLIAVSVFFIFPNFCCLTFLTFSNFLYRCGLTP